MSVVGVGAVMSPIVTMDTASSALQRVVTSRLSIAREKRRIRFISRLNGASFRSGGGRCIRSVLSADVRGRWLTTRTLSVVVVHGWIRRMCKRCAGDATTARPAGSDPMPPAPRGGRNPYGPSPDNRLAVFLRCWQNWRGGYLFESKGKVVELLRT